MKERGLTIEINESAFLKYTILQMAILEADLDEIRIRLDFRTPQLNNIT